MRRPSVPPFRLPPEVPRALLSRQSLIDAGLSAREVTAAVREGRLVRPRRGRYLWTHTHDAVKLAVGEGGRLDCVSLLALLGVFVQDSQAAHVQIHPHSTRLPPTAVGTIRHWRTTDAAEDAVVAPIVEALVQAVRCQTPRAAIATLDSAWHLRLVDEAGIAAVFEALPRRYRRLRGFLDRRAESGTETLVRLMLRTLGLQPELQVKISGVGFVDLLADGWLIVECDSEAHHADWKQIKTDRRRDAAAAAQGYVTLRLLAEDILYRPDWVLGVLRDTLTHGSPAARVHNSGKTAPTAAEKRLPRRKTTESPEL